jgi:hypothetical protein
MKRKKIEEKKNREMRKEKGTGSEIEDEKDERHGGRRQETQQRRKTARKE